MSRPGFRQRVQLPHEAPAWVPDGETYFITVNAIPRGENQLAFDSISDRVVETIRHRIKVGEWTPALWLNMPDHIHALLVINPDVGMEQSLRNWKRYTATNFGLNWQRDFFDRRIRSHQDFDEKWSYIVQNPVRAGLVSKPEDWPYIWTYAMLCELD